MANPLTSFGPFTKAQIEDCFHVFDLDSNTFITANELRHIYSQLGETLTDAELTEMLRIAGSNSTGAVGIKQFTTMIHKYTTPQPPLTTTTSPSHQYTTVQQCCDAMQLKPTDLYGVYSQYIVDAANYDNTLTYPAFLSLLHQPADTPPAHTLYTILQCRSGTTHCLTKLAVATLLCASHIMDKQKLINVTNLLIGTDGRITRTQLCDILQCLAVHSASADYTANAEMIMARCGEETQRTVLPNSVNDKSESVTVGQLLSAYDMNKVLFTM